MTPRDSEETTFEAPEPVPTPDPEAIRAARERDEAAAEAEPEPETNPPTEPDPEEEEAENAPPEPSPEDVALARKFEELDKAQAAYFRKVEKIVGAEEMPPACTHCNGTGLDFHGGEPEPEFQTHEQYIGCDACNGLGRVKTGSKVIGADLMDCPKCLGRGYLEKAPALAAVADEPAEYGTPKWMGDPATGVHA